MKHNWQPAPQRDRTIGAWLTLAPLLVSILLGLPVMSAEVELERQVEAGQWSAAKLRNLPAKAKLAIRVETDAEIRIVLTDRSFEETDEQSVPLYLAAIDGTLTFRFEITAAGDHYLVLDNRSGKQTVSVKVTVNATGPGGSDPAGRATANEILDNFETALHRLFIFAPIDIQVRSCSVPNAYTTTDGGIVLCKDYVKRLQKELESPEQLRDVLVFALFHEVGHTLLEQWNSPFYADEEVADQFATATLIMLNQQSRMTAVIGLFENRSKVSESLVKVLGDTQHPLSADRAANIKRWAADPELLDRWQSVLVPHMQTQFLELLLEKDVPWANAEAVQSELDRRAVEDAAE
jgi:hypothetical protein